MLMCFFSLSFCVFTEKRRRRIEGVKIVLPRASSTFSFPIINAKCGQKPNLQTPNRNRFLNAEIQIAMHCDADFRVVPQTHSSIVKVIAVTVAETLSKAIHLS